MGVRNGRNRHLSAGRISGRERKGRRYQQAGLFIHQLQDLGADTCHLLAPLLDTLAAMQARLGKAFLAVEAVDELFETQIVQSVGSAFGG